MSAPFAKYHKSVASFVDDRTARHMIETILKAMAETVGLQAKDILASKRGQPHAFARQSALFIIGTHTPIKSTQIERVSSLDHSSVFYASKLVADIISVYPTDRALVEGVITNLFGKVSLNGDKEQRT